MQFFDESLLAYSFPPPHPFNSARLADAMRVQGDWGLEWTKPEIGTWEMAESVHDRAYLDFVKRCGQLEELGLDDVRRYGIGTGDTPAFPGIDQAALAVVGATVGAADWLVQGERLAINLAGGLHHAQRGLASGFCALNDIACGIVRLKQKFSRIAYIDVDLHHGDGVQAIFADDPDVLTASIHEFEPGFYPGTGGLEENRPGIVNVPVAQGTNGPLWLRLFDGALMSRVRAFAPEVVVLQMGVDAHFSDPLGHLCVSGQSWIESVRLVAELDLPILGLGGGGYDRRNPPRLWPAAVCALLDRSIPERMPDWFVSQFGVSEPLDDAGDVMPVPMLAGLRANEILGASA